MKVPEGWEVRQIVRRTREGRLARIAHIKAGESDYINGKGEIVSPERYSVFLKGRGAFKRFTLNEAMALAEELAGESFGGLA